MKFYLKLQYLFVLLSLLQAIALAIPDVEKVKAFEDWYATKNPSYTTSKIRLGSDVNDFNENRLGVFAKEDIKANEVILTIPDDAIISWKMVFYQSEISDTITRFHERYNEESEYNQVFYDELAIWLLYQKYQITNSPWKPWLDVLPGIEDMDNTLFWKMGELNELKGLSLYEHALKRRKLTGEKFEWLQRNIFAEYTRVWTTEITHEQWKWAISIVRSTNFQLYDVHGVQQPALVPLLDMFRHDIVPHESPLADKDVWEYDEEKTEDAITISAIKDYAAGDELNLIWVEKCNSELVDFWGMVPEENPNDCVYLDMELDREDPMYNTRNILYSMSHPNPARQKILKNSVTQELLTSVRAITITDFELDSSMLLNGVPKESLGPRSDFAIAEYIANLCRKKYQSYSSTAEDDKAALQDENLPYRVRMAIELRQGEREIVKRIGTYYYGQAKNLLEQLKQLQEEAEQMMREEL